MSIRFISYWLFFINKAKSNWVPAQNGSWIGFLLNFQSATIKTPKRKIQKLETLLNQAVEANQVSAKQISSIDGQLNSMFLAIGNTVRLLLELYTRKSKAGNLGKKLYASMKGLNVNFNFGFLK